jgi:hypothetical protein
MDRVGISFKSPLLPEQIRARYVEPLRDALEQPHAGIYTNYVRRPDDDPQAPAEHLLVFLVRDFQAGLHLLRMKLEEIGQPQEMMLHNLEPSEPMY